jgi:hypothetical protein
MAKAGQPAYVPNQADRATVQNLAALGATHAEICICLGTKGISEKTMRKHFKRELLTSLGEVKALAMSQVIAAMKRGEGWAVCFFLKCRGGWSETSSHRFVDKDGGDRNLLSEFDRLVEAAEKAGE